VVKGGKLELQKGAGGGKKKKNYRSQRSHKGAWRISRGGSWWRAKRGFEKREVLRRSAYRPIRRIIRGYAGISQENVEGKEG